MRLDAATHVTQIFDKLKFQLTPSRNCPICSSINSTLRGDEYMGTMGHQIAVKTPFHPNPFVFTDIRDRHFKVQIDVII